MNGTHMSHMTTRKWRINENDLESATIMLECRHKDGSMGDVLAIPLGSMTPSLLVGVSNADPEDRYKVLFNDAKLIIFSPVSISTIMRTNRYEDMQWDKEDSKVKDISTEETISRVSLSIMRGDHDVYTIELPNPSADDLKTLLGSDS